MKDKLRILILSIILCVIASFLQCSVNVAGGGTEDVNTKTVMGVIYTEGNQPAPNTQVMLITSNYNPVTDAAIPDSLKDTTESDGSYSFQILDSGQYNIEAVHLSQRTRLLLTGIITQNDTTLVARGILKEAGVVKVYLPDTIDTANGYLFIEGTTITSSLSKAVTVPDGGYLLMLDSIPEAIIPSIHYDKLNDPVEPNLMTDTISVLSNDTTVTEAFVYWSNYTKENSGLTHNKINEMRIAPDGSIWIGTVGGLAVLDGDTWTQYTSANSDLPSNGIMDLNFDKKGILWVATLGGVASFDGSQWTVFDSANSGLPTNYCISAVVDKNDTLWCGMYDGIAKYTGTNWVVYDTFNTSIPSCRVEDIAVDSSGYVWIATYNSILKYNNGSWEIYNTSNSSITSNLVFEVDVDRYNNKWFVYDDGASRYDDNNWTGYDRTHSAALDSRVIQIYTDASNNIWIGSQLGLTRFDGAAWKDYMGEKYELLDNKGIYAIAVDKEENVWIGTFNSGVIVFGPTIK